MKQFSNLLCALLIAASIMPTLACAEEIPLASPLDPHIRVVKYDRADQVRLILAFGQRTHIEFGRDEVVTYVSSGDDAAWDIGPAKNIKNHLFIKPADKLPTTNLIVVTNKRTYNFNLTVGTKTTYYADLLFVYPDELKAKADAQRAQSALDGSSAGSEPKPGDNTNYWVQGSDELTPSRAWDDGRFTYISFPAGAQLPAMYTVGDDGEEVIANPAVDAKTGVLSLPFLVKKIVLRRGDKLVACVFNKGYTGPGRGSPTGTISNNVVRTIKGSEQ
ncbi:TrbG/VirB9 family P-type conjugative transfer protein [Paraburkholderia sp. SIMBA_009]